SGGAGAAGTAGTGAAGATGVGAAGGVGAGETADAGPSGGAGAGAVGDGGAAGAGAAAERTGAVPTGSGGTTRPRPYFVPLLEQVLGLPLSPGPAPPLECPQPVQSQSPLQPVSPLPAPSPYTGPTRGLAERRAPASRPASPACPTCTSRRTSRPRPPAVPGTHQMALRPSTAPLRVPLPSPPTSSLPSLADPESDSLRAASPTVARFLATIVTDPSLASTAASALVAELVDFAAHCRLDYAAGLVAESASVCPPSVAGECALGTDCLEERQEELQCFAAALPHLVSTLLALEGDPDAPDIPTPRSYAEAIEGPYSSQWQAAMDAEMASWKSTGTYVDEVPPLGANIVSGKWIFRVKRPPGSPPVFKARYVARGFSQRQGCDYKLHSLDFSTAFLQGSLHEEIWLRRPPGFTGSFPPGTQWSLRRPVYGLRQALHEWHDTLRTTFAALGFAPSTADPSLFLRTDTSLPPFYVLVYVDDLVFATADTARLAHVKSELQKRHTCTDLGELRSYLGLQITRDRAQRTITLTQSHMVQQVLQRFDFTYSLPQATPLSTRHSLSALPLDESVEPSGPYPELVGCLMYLMTCTRPDLAYPLSILARYVAPGRHRPEHMAAAKRVLRYLCSTSGMGLVLRGRSPVVLTGHADASWVDDLATQWSSQGYTFSLGSSSVSWRSTHSSFVLNSGCEAEIYARAMATQELRWLTYLLTDLGEPPRSPPVLNANTADIFTKALQPCDHQRFCTMLACFALLCLTGLFTKFPFSSGTGSAKALLALVHMDVVGPTRAPSLSSNHYFLTIVDDHTRPVWVYPLKTKGEVAATILKEWLPRAQRESGHKVKVIGTDNGGEFIGNEFEAVLKKQGIRHQVTVPYNPHQNGVAEQFNRTLQDGAHTLLGRAGLLDPFWVTALWESGHKVTVIHTDNGGELIGNEFEALLKKKGIQHQLTVPYNPQQNGMAEQFNWTLQEGAHTLLRCAGLPDPFWVIALRQVALVKNKVLATVGDKQWVPCTKWYGSVPAVNMLRTFGCIVMFHVTKENRGKLEASGRWGVHLGISKDHKGWLVWDFTSQKLTVSRDVKFFESVYYKEWKHQQQKLPTILLIIEANEVQRPFEATVCYCLRGGYLWGD
ncbi:unnamed protein product, partial [Closterium sp. NIES-53]